MEEQREKNYNNFDAVIMKKLILFVIVRNIFRWLHEYSEPVINFLSNNFSM